MNSARLLLRRWYVIAGGLVVTGIALGAMYVEVPNVYSASTTIVLLVPPTGGVYQAPEANGPKVPSRIANPYLAFDNSLMVIAKIVADGLTTDEAKQAFKARGYTATYDIVLQTGGPLVDVKTSDPDPKVGLSTRDAVVAAFEADVVNRQRKVGAPESTWASASVANSDRNAKRTTQKLRTLAIAAGLGLAASISLVFIVEALLGLRRRAEAKPMAFETDGGGAGTGTASLHRPESLGPPWPVTQSRTLGSTSAPHEPS